MKLTKENKEHINSLSYESLLSKWRFASVGDKWMEGETGEYWGKCMGEKRNTHPDPVEVSKRLGWGKP